MNKFEQLMILTMEECGELTQACSKQMRGSPSAQKLLLEEVGDVQCMINLIIKNGLLSQEDVQERVKFKLDKLSKWSDMT